VKDVERIKLNNTAQLGSLEDTMQVKRLDAAKIRRMRAQTQEQTKIGFSIMRYFGKTWIDFQGALGLLFTVPTKDCDKNGHKPHVGYGGVLKCRTCGLEIQSLEQLMRLD
jgi:hypothetical protein